MISSQNVSKNLILQKIDIYIFAVLLIGNGYINIREDFFEKSQYKNSYP